MKTLILCVDRDDDLGRKAGISTPIIGRRSVVDAAMRLGLADPEDSDTNALLASVHLYDGELEGRHGEQVEVAAIAGHQRVGIKSDRILADQLDEVLATTRADQVVMVTDGAEDEAILPILHSRTKVTHVHRSIVKQAPRLEGAWYILTRILDDEKMAKRYVLPLGLITLVWGFAFLLNWQVYAWGATLAISGGWLVVHAMKWEQGLGKFFHQLGQDIRDGRLIIVALFVIIGLLVLGGFQSYNEYQRHAATNDTVLQSLHAAQEVMLFTIAAALIFIAARLFDGWAKEGNPGMGNAMAAFMLIAIGLIGSVVLDLIIIYREGAAFSERVDPGMLLRLLAGFITVMAGNVLARYVRNFFPNDRIQTR